MGPMHASGGLGPVVPRAADRRRRGSAIVSLDGLQYDPPVSESLEQRVRRLEDRFAINDLVVAYATLLDDAQWDALGQLFTEDGVFASPNSTTTGRAAIVENFKVKHAPFAATWHDPHGIAVEFDDDDHARGTVIGYAELGQPGVTITTAIRYQDDYRREDGAWRFAKRHVLSLYGMPSSVLAAGGLGVQDRKRWPGRPAGPAELPDFERRYPGYPG
jgi:uncharacterized protein (TIGR02246 family)